MVACKSNLIVGYHYYWESGYKLTYLDRPVYERSKTILYFIQSKR